MEARDIRLESIEQRVRRLVAACVLPAWLAASLITFFVYQHEREDQVDETVLRARVLMQQAERELTANIGVLQALATSGSIDDRDLPRLHVQANEVARQAAADNIVWFDSPLHVMLSAAHPLGAPLPQTAKDRFPGLFTQGLPMVSDLFIGQVSQRPQIAIAVPIHRAGAVVGRLDMILTPQRLGQLIQQQGLSPEWTAAIVDRNGVVVARNRDPQRFVGRQASPDLLDQLGEREEGHFEGRTAEGTLAIGCFSRSTQFGWTAAIGVPLAGMRAVLLKRLGLISLAGALVLAAGMLLAQRLSRRIAAPVQALVTPALKIGRGETTSLPPTRLKEIAEVSNALEQAQALLKQRDLSRRIAESALEDSQSRLSMALDISRVGTWELDQSTQTITRSRRLEECLGHAEVPPKWTLPDFIAHFHADDRERLAREIEQLQADRSHRCERTDARVVWPDGTEHVLAWRAARLDEENGRVRIVGIVTDVTQQQQAERLKLEQVRIEAEHRQLHESNRLKGEFLANLSHELRTPLNAIIGFADVLRVPAVASDPRKHDTYLGHISSAGQHLLTLVNDLLDLAKIESGKFTFSPQATDIADLIDEVVGVLEASAQAKHIVLDQEIDPGTRHATLDPSRLKQVLFNFVSNAIKFTPDGGRVTLRSGAHSPGHLRIEVQDNGIGISEADQRLLFTQFHQVRSAQAKEHRGTGLGLALSRELVERQGGWVGVRSAPGAGSTFYVVMPVEPANHHPPRHTDAPAEPRVSGALHDPSE